MTLTEIPGIKLAYMIAGFAGGVVSLSYVRSLTKMQAFGAVVTGTLVANYVTPVMQHYLTMPVALENGAAFIVGLCSMNIVPGILGLSARWRREQSRQGAEK